MKEVACAHAVQPPEEDRLIDLYLSVRFTIHRTDYSADERKVVNMQFADLMELLTHSSLDRKLARDMLVIVQPLLNVWMHNGVLLDCVRAIEDATESGSLTVALFAQAHMLLTITRDEYEMPQRDVQRIIARLERCAGRAQLTYSRGRRIPVT